MARFNGLLLLFIIVGAFINLVKADDDASIPRPDNFKKYNDSVFTTVEGNYAGVMGRTLEEFAARYHGPELDFYSVFQAELFVRQFNFVGKSFTYNETDMTAGNISAATQMDWVNVSRSYFGSNAELLIVSAGCKEYTLQVSSSDVPVIIISPEDSKATTYIESSDMAKRKLKLCYDGEEDTGVVTVWVIPNGKNLIYNSTGDEVLKVGGSEFEVDYTAGRIITEVTGGCLVIPFEFDMIFVPFTFVSIEVDVEYHVWVQDASVNGFVVCFKPDGNATEKNVTIHYVATTNFEVKETGTKACTFYPAIFADKRLPSIMDAVIQGADVGLAAYVAEASLDGQVTYYNSDKCQVKYGTEISQEEAATIDEAFLQPIGDVIFANLSKTEIVEFLKPANYTKEQLDSVTFVVIRAVTRELCEPHGYKNIGDTESAIWSSEFFGTCRGNNHAPPLPTPATNNDYTKYAEYVGETPTATSLKRSQEVSTTVIEKVTTTSLKQREEEKGTADDSSGLEMSGIPLSGLLALLLSAFIVFL